MPMILMVGETYGPAWEWEGSREPAEKLSSLDNSGKPQVTKGRPKNSGCRV